MKDAWRQMFDTKWEIEMNAAGLVRFEHAHLQKAIDGIVGNARSRDAAGAMYAVRDMVDDIKKDLDYRRTAAQNVSATPERLEDMK
jgi:hypothetical protein